MIVSDRGFHSYPVMEDGFPVVYAMLWPPFECPRCHRMTAAVITRHTKHHCPECDVLWKAELKLMREKLDAPKGKSKKDSHK